RESPAELSEGIVGHPKLGVRHGVVEIHEERARIVSFDERRSLSCEQVVDVIAIDIGVQPLAVAPEMVCELPMRMAMIQEPERVIEPLSIRLAGRARLAEPPLTDHRRTVTGATQDFRDRHVLET